MFSWCWCCNDHDEEIIPLSICQGDVSRYEARCDEAPCCDPNNFNNYNDYSPDVACRTDRTDCCDVPCKKTIINIENDHDITDKKIQIYDCMIINILNCSKITRVPEINGLQWLEDLTITHCNIIECRNIFPVSLRTLTLTYCNMEIFEPRCINIENLASINLSFNRLKKLPPILGEFGGNLNLKNNDLWYTAYSDLPDSKVVEAHELAVAYKLNILSTERVNTAIRILSRKNLSESTKLQNFVNMEFSKRMTYLKNTSANAQNIHLISVQNSTKNSIEYIMKTVPYTDDVEQLLKDASVSLGIDLERIKLDIKHPYFKVTLYDIFSRVYTIVRIHQYRETLFAILTEEITAGLNTCLTGLFSRIIGSLSGFVENVKVTINSREELLNTIVAMRRNYAVLFGNTDQYITEITPVVWQMLEDFCVPEPEHLEWLAYL